MASTSIIQFAPAFQRRRERHSGPAAFAKDYSSWDRHYPAGIDGLWTEPQAMGKVVPFLRP
jgi:hypothetical protein